MNSSGNSLLGLVLEFSSPTTQKNSLFLADSRSTTQISSQFKNVIMPHRIKNWVDGWTIQECSIQMRGRTLKGIHALCYRANQNPSISSEYYALLGDIKISSSRETPKFPPSTSWLVGGEFFSWSSSPKRVSLKLTWRLKAGEDDYNVFSKYNVYLDKQKSESGESEMLLLGVVGLRCFYVSDVEVASGVKSLRFVIQVCSVDGSCRKLQDSPFYVLQVQG